jgi:hypothetical protein
MTFADITEDMTMTNGTDPSGMTGQERMAEVSMLLSLAMMRLWLKRRDGMRMAAAPERAISREYSLGLGAQSLPPVTAGKP